MRHVRSLFRARSKSRAHKSRSRLNQRDAELLLELVLALSPERVRNDGVARKLSSHDASIYDDGVAGPVCYPVTTAEVAAIVEIATRYDRNIVPRGAGTGLAGGAVPLGAPIVVVMTKMNRIFSVDLANRVAWVGPGVVNLDLTRELAPLGYHFAPDPSSQQVCTIGGNVANNSGGPHCLAYGVTNAHVKAIEVVLANGEVILLGGIDAHPPGLDLRGAFIGGEGTLGIATRIAVAITPNPPAVKTLLAGFESTRSAAQAVSDIIAGGIVPAALEVLDQRITVAIETYVEAGYPTEAAAVLLAEVDGLAEEVEIESAAIAQICSDNAASSIKMAADEAERTALWKGRKTAFGAIARVAPDYYLHDTVVPRSKLADVLDRVYEIADAHQLIVMNVFHAGDGNLHPLLVFDSREPGVLDRVHAAGAEILKVSLDAGGVLSGEHGIGIEKRRFMSEYFADEDLEHQNRLRHSFDPGCRMNPGKVLPEGHSCADISALYAVPDDVWI